MSKIRNSASGAACMIRIPGVCNFNPQTTVLAHYNRVGWGKGPDFIGAYACSDCHDAVDGRSHTKYSKQELDLMFFEGIQRTQELLYKSGLIQTKGSK